MHDHLSTSRQAGQRNGTSIEGDKDSNAIVFVVSPVLTGTFSIGQLVKILAIADPRRTATKNGGSL